MVPSSVASSSTVTIITHVSMDCRRSFGAYKIPSIHVNLDNNGASSSLCANVELNLVLNWYNVVTCDITSLGNLPVK